MRTTSPVIPAALLTLALALTLTTFVDAAAQSFLFVSSRNTNSVKYYDATTTQYLGDFVRPSLGGLSAPQEVLIAPSGELLVTGRFNSAILAYNLDDGSFIGPFTSGYALDNPTKTTFGPDGHLYVSQWGTTQNKVVRFDGTTGAFIDEFTSIGLNQGCGHAWDDDGNLYVASFGSRDVRKFNPTGIFMGVFATLGGGPVNLWFADDGDLYVLDWTNGAVSIFNGQTGAFRRTFITGLANAEGFAFGPDDKIYICDWTLNRVNRYNPSGSFFGLFTASGGMSAPNSLVFGGGTTAVESTSWGRIKGLYR